MVTLPRLVEKIYQAFYFFPLSPSKKKKQPDYRLEIILR